MALKQPPFLTSKIKGASKVKELLRRAEFATQMTLSRDGLKTLILGRHKRRFDEGGQGGELNPAQRDPDGNEWPDVSESTRRYHPNTLRLLYDTGALRKAVHVVRSQMSPRQLQSPTGGGFRIGVRGNQKDKAEAHQKGTDVMPARRFLGVGKQDVVAVDNWIKRNYATFGIRVR